MSVLFTLKVSQTPVKNDKVLFVRLLLMLHYFTAKKRKFAADNHLDPLLFSVLQYSQLFLAFFIGYFFEGEKFPLSRIILVVLFLMSVLFTLKVSQTPVKNDKRKLLTAKKRKLLLKKHNLYL